MGFFDSFVKTLEENVIQFTVLTGFVRNVDAHDFLFSVNSYNNTVLFGFYMGILKFFLDSLGLFLELIHVFRFVEHTLWVRSELCGFLNIKEVGRKRQ